MKEERQASEITKMLRDWSDHRSDDSADALLKIAYAELHRQAHRFLRKERGGHTLQTTALVTRLISNSTNKNRSRGKAARTSSPLPLR